MPTVVLAHGWTLTRASWLPVVEPLVDAGVRVVTYDQRGHGESSPLRGAAVGADAGRRPRRRPRRRGPARARRPGRALHGRHDRDGAMPGCTRTTSAPGWRGSCWCRPAPTTSEPAARCRGEGDGRRRADAADPGWTLRHGPGPAPPAVRRRPRPGPRAADPRHGGQARRCRRWAASSVPSASTTRARRSRQLRGIPTLVLVGDRDKLTPPRHAHRLAELVPHAELRELPGPRPHADVRGHRRGRRCVPVRAGRGSPGRAR